MDWFTWLTKTDLDPSLAYQYALIFNHNELEEVDLTYFSHEFLQSMGISIAKHRIHILKLARNNKKHTRIHPVSWFVFAVKRTKNYISKCMHDAFVVHRENSALSMVPKRSSSLRWKVAMLQRSKRVKTTLDKREWPMLRGDGPSNGVLMLTNGSPLEGSRSSGSSSSSRWGESEANAVANPWSSSFERTTVQSQEGEYWSSSTEEIKWDSMFRNLKPT